MRSQAVQLQSLLWPDHQVFILVPHSNFLDINYPTQVWTGGRLGKNAEALTYLRISFSFWLCHMACGNPCFPTRDRTHTSCIGSSESQSLDLQEVTSLLISDLLIQDASWESVWYHVETRQREVARVKLNISACVFSPPYLRPFNKSTYIMVIIVADIKWMISRC